MAHVDGLDGRDAQQSRPGLAGTLVALGLALQGPGEWERGIVRRGVEGDPPHGRQEPRGGLLLVETAAHLVDHVFPRVPVRQWVLSFPWPLRLLFASRPDRLTRVLNVVTRALSTAVLKGAGAPLAQAREEGYGVLLHHGVEDRVLGAVPKKAAARATFRSSRTPGPGFT